ncbi:MAG TPA: Ig-like domain-containing protein [Gemmatimonadales bacterium]
MRAAYNSALTAVGLSGALVFAACEDTSVIADVVVRVEVAPDRDTVFVGEVAQRVSAEAFNARGDVVTTAPVTWRSDQPFVASVDSVTGAITGVSIGSAAVTAKSGPVSDTAQIFVVDRLALRLPIDTLLLVPGDTMTVPVSLTSRDGETPPAVTFSGGNPAVATIDAVTGLVTAIGPGVVAYGVQADSLSSSGGIQVLVITDSMTTGFAYVGLHGYSKRLGRMGAEGFNHPTTDARSVFQLSAATLNSDLTLREQFGVLLLDSLTAPRIQDVDELPPSGVTAGSDPVCEPPGSWVFYRDERGSATVRALSVAGGTVSITSVTPIPGGRVVSGRVSATLQQADLIGALTTAMATFVVPLTVLPTCPT